jgi:RimJ/RimL family protein N-acetyltransferase
MNLDIGEVTEKDAKLLFEWTNDPVTRENSFNTSPVKWNDHVLWLNKKLNDPFCKMFIFHQNNQPVGVVRFDTDENTIIGVTVAPTHRGMGIGAEIIKMGCLKFWEISHQDIMAYIKEGNLASLHAFEKAGFSFYKNDIYNNFACLILTAKKNGN